MTPIPYNTREIELGRVSAIQLAFFVDADDLVSAVKAFQAFQGLLVDGMLGPKTRAAVDALRAPPTGKLYQPLQGGCWWSRNEFQTWHDDDCPTREGEECDCDYHPARDGFDGPKGIGGWPVSAGAVVIAPMDGEVILRGWQDNGLWYRMRHTNGYETLSGHGNEKLVEVGAEVTAGTPLSSLWKGVNPPHLHHGVWDGEKWIDPVEFYREAEVRTG